MICSSTFKYVLGCIFYHDHQLMIIERNQSMPSHRGQLGFFGGGIKPQKGNEAKNKVDMEYLKQELLREVAEETGFEKDIFQCVEYVFDDYTYDGSPVAVFRLEVKSNNVPIPKSNGEWSRFGFLDCKLSCSTLFFHPLKIESRTTNISRDTFLVALAYPVFQWNRVLKDQMDSPVMLWGMSARVLKKILDQQLFVFKR
jgi:8-oxo-dGTP pyrophosphatase MutT (NUDIX family)